MQLTRVDSARTLLKTNGALKSAPFSFTFQVNQLTYDHRVDRAIGTRTGGEEDQFQRVLPGRNLTGVIPAGLVRTDIMPFIDRPHKDII